MPNCSRFSKKSRFTVPVSDLFQWHCRPGAILRLSPPWDPLTIVRADGGIHAGANVRMKMKAGPFDFAWHARHTEYLENEIFRDVQIKGPFALWEHTHCFSPDTDHACFLEDVIDYRLPLYPFSHWVLDRFVREKLARIFEWRHRTLAMDLADHRRLSGRKPLTILISGASGLIGSALIPYLTTGGHQVIRLVRNRKKLEHDEAFWDPYRGILRMEGKGPIDAVIHLSGDNIGQGRWTRGKKKKILSSRTTTTRFLAEALLRFTPRPKVFICASATGYYGNDKKRSCVEDDPPGTDFISDVCVQWENSAAPAREAGIRLVLLRVGVVLTPVGGALARFLPAFRFGPGIKKIGSGTQWLSWIGIDDVLGAVHHVLANEAISGPVNLVSPCPVTQRTFHKTLAEVLSRPALVSVPAWAVKSVFGQMGGEILLSGVRVMPEKLLETGYRFRFGDLESALRHVLGKTKDVLEKS
jgi:uncharacterized protein